VVIGNVSPQGFCLFTCALVDMVMMARKKTIYLRFI